MERHEFPVSGDAERRIEAVERGDEVYLTRDGKPVARVEAAQPLTAGSLDLPALVALRSRFAHLRVPDTAKLIRGMRDADEI